MKETLTTQDDKTATVETVDGKTRWTESSPDTSKPETFTFDRKTTLELKAIFESKAEDFADDARFHAIFGNSAARLNRLQAENCKQLAAMLDRAAKDIS